MSEGLPGRLFCCERWEIMSNVRNACGFEGVGNSAGSGFLKNVCLFMPAHLYSQIARAVTVNHQISRDLQQHMLLRRNSGHKSDAKSQKMPAALLPNTLQSHEKHTFALLGRCDLQKYVCIIDA